MATRNKQLTAPDAVDETVRVNFSIDPDDPESPESLGARVRVRVYVASEAAPYSARLNTVAGGGTAVSPNLPNIYTAALADWGY